MFKKIFTIKEANRRLPLVKKIVQDILKKGHEMRTIADQFKGKEPPVEYFNLQAQIELLMMELEDLGCFYKDWNFQIGLVDFPAVIDGKEILLCWRSDEEKLQWYHGLDDGYAGRKLIPEKLL